MNISFLGLTCGYGTTPIIKDFTAQVTSSEILCILGPNGIGKTTLFKTVLGLLPALGGHILLDNRDLLAMSDRNRARSLSYVPQAHTPSFPYSVMEVVLMGRAPYLGAFQQPGQEDKRIARQALEKMGIDQFSDRVYSDLSGGERQMVLIARAVAQQSPVLILDEPTANLDFGNQAKVLQHVKNLAADGYIVIMTTHAPEHALLCRSTVALITRDGAYRTGSATDIVTPEILRGTYGVNVHILSHTTDTGEIISACIPAI